jgi:hypothetical protein
MDGAPGSLGWVRPAQWAVYFPHLKIEMWGTL